MFELIFWNNIGPVEINNLEVTLGYLFNRILGPQGARWLEKVLKSN